MEKCITLYFMVDLRCCWVFAAMMLACSGPAETSPVPAPKQAVEEPTPEPAGPVHLPPDGTTDNEPARQVEATRTEDAAPDRPVAEAKDPDPVADEPIETAEEPVAQSTLVLAFDHRVAGKPLVLEEALETTLGKAAIKTLRYWVTNITLRSSLGDVALPGSYYLIEQTKTETRTQITLHDVPPGEYTGLQFSIGVEPEKNHHLDQFDGELQAGISIDWAWKTGFIFFKMEGTLGSKKFVYHVGEDENFKTLTLELPAPLSMLQDQESTLTVQAALENAFEGVGAATAMFGPPAAAVMNNMPAIFSVP